MKVRVFKSSGNKNTFRTPLSELDSMPSAPEVGKPLLLASSTHESGGIMTSIVESIEKEQSSYIVRTKNSSYLIEID